MEKLTHQEEEIMLVIWKKKRGNTYLYIPRITQTEYKKKFLSGIVKSYFSNSYKEMVTFFAHEQKLSEEDLRQIIEMIERGKS